MENPSTSLWSVDSSCVEEESISTLLDHCKRLTLQLQLHLTTQKNRRESILRQSRTDVAQILQNGRPQQALTRVQLLYKDQCLLAAYDQINQLCECIISNIHHISQQCNWQCLPIDASRAMSNLIFAASRLGNLPELHKLRNLFRNHYGSKFDVTNVELLPGNLVDSQLKENLCVNSVPEDVKLRLVHEIAQEIEIHLGFQDIVHRFRPQWQEKAEVLDLNVQDICSDSDESSMPATRLKTPIAFESLDYRCTNSLGNRIKVKKNEVVIRQEASATSSSSDGTLPIHDTYFVYLDDLEVKSLNQRLSSSKKAPRSVDSCISSTSPSSVSNVKNTSANRRSRKKSIPPKPQLCNNGHYRMPIKDRRSLDSSIDEWKAQSVRSSHVHPKIPNYEDVVATFTDIKAEYRHRRSFYY